MFLDAFSLHKFCELFYEYFTVFFVYAAEEGIAFAAGFVQYFQLVDV